MKIVVLVISLLFICITFIKIKVDKGLILSPVDIEGLIIEPLTTNRRKHKTNADLMLINRI